MTGELQDWPISRSPTIEEIEAKFAPSVDTLDPVTRDLRQQIERDAFGAGRQDLSIPDSDADACRASVRRLITAWLQLDNDEMGYAQAMAGISLVLLVNAEQSLPRAFTCFSQLMATLPAFFYDEELRGCRIEVRSLWLLACARWPDEIASRPEVREPMELVVTQWFLSLWVGTLSPTDCARCWGQMVRVHDRLTQQKRDALTSSTAAPASAAFDTMLRVALALIGVALKDIIEAATSDAAMDVEVDGGSGGAETYAALRNIARRPDLTEVVAMALAETRPGVKAIDNARGKACEQLEQHAAEEAARKVELRRQRAVVDADAGDGHTAGRASKRRMSAPGWSLITFAAVGFVAVIVSIMASRMIVAAVMLGVSLASASVSLLLCWRTVDSSSERGLSRASLARNDDAAQAAHRMEEAIEVT